MMLISARVRNLLSSQGMVIVLILLLSMILFELSQIAYKRFETEKEISDDEKEIAKLEDRQAQLKSLLTFLNTDYFAEREARLKLGMQKPGEQVLVIPRSPSAAGDGASNQGLVVEPGRRDNVPMLQQDAGQVGNESEATPVQNVTNKNNPTRWQDYFFGEIE